MSAHTLAIFHMPWGAELLIIAFVGLLIFGRRLPEIGRSLGKGIVEFKRGVRDVEHDVDEAAAKPSNDSGERKSLPPSDKS